MFVEAGYLHGKEMGLVGVLGWDGRYRVTGSFWGYQGREEIFYYYYRDGAWAWRMFWRFRG